MTDVSRSRPALLIDRCVCRNRLFADLLPEARARTWSLNELTRQTGCGGQCGLCRPYLRRMLATGETAFDHILPADGE
jgi:bacterioferritin-associated ferredoxin